MWGGLQTHVPPNPNRALCKLSQPRDRPPSYGWNSMPPTSKVKGMVQGWVEPTQRKGRSLAEVTGGFWPWSHPGVRGIKSVSDGAARSSDILLGRQRRLVHLPSTATWQAVWPWVGRFPVLSLLTCKMRVVTPSPHQAAVIQWSKASKQHCLMTVPSNSRGLLQPLLLLP